jgi:hypothetical protein
MRPPPETHYPIRRSESVRSEEQVLLGFTWQLLASRSEVLSLTKGKNGFGAPANFAPTANRRGSND